MGRTCQNNLPTNQQHLKLLWREDCNVFLFLEFLHPLLIVSRNYWRSLLCFRALIRGLTYIVLSPLHHLCFCTCRLVLFSLCNLETKTKMTFSQMGNGWLFPQRVRESEVQRKESLKPNWWYPYARHFKMGKMNLNDYWMDSHYCSLHSNFLWSLFHRLVQGISVQKILKWKICWPSHLYSFYCKRYSRVYFSNRISNNRLLDGKFWKSQSLKHLREKPDCQNLHLFNCKQLLNIFLHRIFQKSLSWMSWGRSWWNYFA